MDISTTVAPYHYNSSNESDDDDCSVKTKFQEIILKKTENDQTDFLNEKELPDLNWGRIILKVHFNQKRELVTFEFQKLVPGKTCVKLNRRYFFKATISELTKTKWKSGQFIINRHMPPCRQWIIEHVLINHLKKPDLFLSLYRVRARGRGSRLMGCGDAPVWNACFSGKGGPVAIPLLLCYTDKPHIPNKKSTSSSAVPAINKDNDDNISHSTPSSMETLGEKIEAVTLKFVDIPKPDPEIMLGFAYNRCTQLLTFVVHEFSNFHFIPISHVADVWFKLKFKPEKLELKVESVSHCKIPHSMNKLNILLAEERFCKGVLKVTIFLNNHHVKKYFLEIDRETNEHWQDVLTASQLSTSQSTHFSDIIYRWHTLQIHSNL